MGLVHQGEAGLHRVGVVVESIGEGLDAHVDVDQALHRAGGAGGGDEAVVSQALDRAFEGAEVGLAARGLEGVHEDLHVLDAPGACAW